MLGFFPVLDIFILYLPQGRNGDDLCVWVFFRVTNEPFDTDKMAQEFQRQFPANAMTKGQLMVFGFLSKPNLRLSVKNLSSKWSAPYFSCVSVGIVCPFGEHAEKRKWWNLYK